MAADLTPPAPKADPEQMLRALRLMHEPDEVVELRCIRGRQIVAGFFDAAHWPELVKIAARLNAQGFAAYHVANVADPGLHGRYHNRVADRDVATTTDRDVVRRRWLLLDFDPARPKDTAATDAQLQAAQELADQVQDYLSEWGWAQPLRAMSGNGVHLHYRVDLPNDAAAAALIERTLKALAARFDTAAVKVDRGVFNAARVWKIAGSVANKGDHTAARPHRLSRITWAPPEDRLPSILRPQDLLQVAEWLEGEQRAAAASTAWTAPPRVATGSASASDAVLSRVLQALGERGIEYRERDGAGGARQLQLSRCPFVAEHDRGEASIFVQASGAMGFKCLHNTCADKGWRQLRELVLGSAPRKPPAPAVDTLLRSALRALDTELQAITTAAAAGDAIAAAVAARRARHILDKVKTS